MYNDINSLTNGISNINVNELPIIRYKNEIIETVRKNQIVIIFGDTGSGKTTQIPQYLLESGINAGKIIAVTQPRRIAAINMAARVSQEMCCPLGIEVGYEIRFDKKTSGSTKIKFMTDGILLNQCLMDAKLTDYGVVMIDEAHERTVDTDVLIGLLKMIAECRKDLKILITSATMKSEKFSKYFFKAPIISFDGRMFPVEIIYDPFTIYSINSVTSVVRKIHSGDVPGDVLVFLTGQDEIEECCERLEHTKDLVVLPLYGAMDYVGQQSIFKPVESGQRKVIVATNIAETSITIDGIRFVIDCGYVKQNQYNSQSGIETLQSVRISQAQADQRKGRAGRTNTGWCYRLYSQSTYMSMSRETNPEIFRKNLCGTCLKLVAMGLEPLKFNFIDPPEEATLRKCLEELQDLELLNDKKQITELGKMMEDFPVEPRIGKTLLISKKYGCSVDVVTILAMLTERNIFCRPKKTKTQSDAKKSQFTSSDGDHFMLLNVYKKFKENGSAKQWCYSNFINFKSMEQVDLVRTQLICIMKRKNLLSDSTETTSDNISIKKALVSGFYKNICFQKSKGVYINYYNKQTLFVHPSSCLMNSTPIVILYNEVIQTKRPFMTGILALTDDILKHFPMEMKKIHYQRDITYPKTFLEQLLFNY